MDFLNIWDSNTTKVLRVKEAIAIGWIENVLARVITRAVVALSAACVRRQCARRTVAGDHGHTCAIILFHVSLKLGFEPRGQDLGLVKVIEVEADHLVDIAVALAPPRL